MRTANIQSKWITELERSSGLSIEEVRNLFLCDMLDYGDQRKKVDREVDRSLEKLEKDLF